MDAAARSGGGVALDAVVLDDHVAALGVDGAAAPRPVGEHDDGDDDGAAGRLVVAQYAVADGTGAVVGEDCTARLSRVLFEGAVGDGPFALIKVDPAAAAHRQPNVKEGHFQIRGRTGGAIVADGGPVDDWVALVEIDAAAAFRRVVANDGVDHLRRAVIGVEAAAAFARAAIFDGAVDDGGRGEAGDRHTTAIAGTAAADDADVAQRGLGVLDIDHATGILTGLAAALTGRAAVPQRDVFDRRRDIVDERHHAAGTGRVKRGGIGAGVPRVHAKVPAALNGHLFGNVDRAAAVACHANRIGQVVKVVDRVGRGLKRGVVDVGIADPTPLESGGDGPREIAVDQIRARDAGDVDRRHHFDKALVGWRAGCRRAQGYCDQLVHGEGAEGTRGAAAAGAADAGGALLAGQREIETHAGDRRVAVVDHLYLVLDGFATAHKQGRCADLEVDAVGIVLLIRTGIHAKGARADDALDIGGNADIQPHVERIGSALDMVVAVLAVHKARVADAVTG